MTQINENQVEHESSATQSANVPNILFVVGSLRKESFNRQLARQAEQLLGERANVTYLDYTDVPFMNQDIEFPAPAAVTRVREAVEQADAVWLFTPEYNHSYPATVKNLFDWLSRPLMPNDVTSPTTASGMKIAVSACAGSSAALNVTSKTIELLQFIRANVYVDVVTHISLSRESFMTNELQMTELDTLMLQQQIEGFLEFIK